MLSAPLAAVRAFPGSSANESQSGPAENAEAAAEPRDSAAVAAGETFEKGFGFRRQLIALDAAFREAVFKESSNSLVASGRNGWLFLGETVDRESPANAYSSRLPGNIAHTLALVNEYLTANGVYFILAVAPNKASVYPEYLPYYAPNPNAPGDSLAYRLYDELDILGVPYIDFKDKLAAQKTPEHTLYHKRDTHWNNIGAMAAYREIAERIAAEMLARGTECPYDGYGAAMAEPLENWTGDLDLMLDPETGTKDVQYDYRIGRNYESRKPIVSFDDMEIITGSDTNGVKIIMFRDSFANALIPLLSNNFGEAAYLRSVPYAFNRAVSRGYDVAVLEIAERNLPEIANRAPVIPAPRRQGYGETAFWSLSSGNGETVTQGPPYGNGETAIQDPQHGNGETTIQGSPRGNGDGSPPVAEIDIAEFGSLVKITGFYDPSEMFEGINYAYLLLSESDFDSPENKTDLTGNADNACAADVWAYEAFPFPDSGIAQKAKERYGASAGEAGFALYLDFYDLPEGEYSLRLLIESKGGGRKLFYIADRFFNSY